MKVWIISYSNPARNSGYICSIWLDEEKALKEFGEISDMGNDCRYQIDEFLVSE